MFKAVAIGLIAAVSADVDTVRKSVASVRDSIASTREAIGNAAEANEAEMSKLLNKVGGIGNTMEQIDDLVLRTKNLGGLYTELEDRIKDAMSLQNQQIKSKIDVEWAALQIIQQQDMADLHAELTQNISDLKMANKARESAVEDPIAGYTKTANDVKDALKLTHYVNKKAPVYRWNFWDNYLNTGLGWYDGNNVRSFGGVNPSRWGDGNVRADQMHDNISYLKRLFSKPGFGDQGHGSNVCSMQIEIPHSTNDLRCGALFRIKNVGTGTVTWRVDWSYTGWSGWGGQASCAVRRRNVWAGSCHGSCNRGNSFSIPANKQKNRISTVVFIAGSAYPYGHYNHHRVTMLQFNNLNLPTNLEVIDDMSTVDGNAKWPS